MRQRPNSPFRESYDAVVAGGGAAGMACALAAAARGADVLLLERTAELGGTVANALIHTIGGLFDDQGNLLNAGLAAELADRLVRASEHTRKRRIGRAWVLNADPALYRSVIQDWIGGAAHLDVRRQAAVTRVLAAGGRVEQIEISGQEGTAALSAKALVDATGDANVVRQLSEELVEDGAAMGGLIVQLRGVAPDALQFPKGIGLAREVRKAVDDGQLPPECSAVWFDSGVYPDEAYAKFGVAPQGYDDERMRDVTVRLEGFLRTMPGMADAYIRERGQLGIRDAGRIKGEYRLTERDVVGGSRFPDAACRAAWPIEHWHAERGLTLEYLPAGLDYDIPLRSLKVAGFTNLWAAGKCLSAEPRAQASARVAGTCWAMGEAVGKSIGTPLA